MNAQTRKHYHSYRKAGLSARDALRAARIKAQFNALASAGFVRLEMAPDCGYNPEDYTPADWAHVHGGLRAMKAAQKAERDLLERYGAHGIIGFFRLIADGAPDDYTSNTAAEWQHADSVYGFLDYFGIADNPYLPDIMDETVRAFRDAKRRQWADAHRGRPAPAPWQTSRPREFAGVGCA